MSSVQAIVLRSIKHGETSLIVNCYTQEYGYQSYILKGIRKSTRGRVKLSRSLFEPMNLLELITSEQPEDRLGYIREAKSAYVYQSISFDPQKKVIILFLYEFLYQVLREEGGVNSPLFKYIIESLKWLDLTDECNNFHLKFLLVLTKHLGCFPNVANQKAPFFDLQKARYSFVPPSNVRYLHGYSKKMWDYFLGTNFETLSTKSFKPHLTETLLENLFEYFNLHFSNFKIPNTIKLLNETIRS